MNMLTGRWSIQIRQWVICFWINKILKLRSNYHLKSRKSNREVIYLFFLIKAFWILVRKKSTVKFKNGLEIHLFEMIDS